MVEISSGLGWEYLLHTTNLITVTLFFCVNQAVYIIQLQKTLHTGMTVMTTHGFLRFLLSQSLELKKK